MLNFTGAKFRYDPYPIGIVHHVFEAEHYTKLVKVWPDEKLFKRLTGPYNKLALSERCNPDLYARVIEASHAWHAFHAYIKSLSFVEQVFMVLREHHVNVPPAGRYTSRFEFSSLPADGGGIEPHTDIPSKVVTLILPMLKQGEWDITWGGGTDILRQRDPYKLLEDYKASREEFDRVETFHYAPNQCVIFIKTFNSWHSVGPISGYKSPLMRRTLTVNIERAV
jgi:hypothetical protein